MNIKLQNKLFSTLKEFYFLSEWEIFIARAKVQEKLVRMNSWYINSI